MKTNKKYFGQAIVEFALVLILFLTLMLGTIDWGFYLYSTMIMDTAVRDAVRFGVTYADWSTNFDTRAADLRAIVVSRAAFLPLNTRTGLSGRTVITLNPDITNIQSITVAIRNQPFTPLTGFMQTLIPARISTQATMRYERR